MRVKKKTEIPEGKGGLHKPLWNGNSEWMGVKTKKPSVGGGVWIFSGITQYKLSTKVSQL